MTFNETRLSGPWRDLEDDLRTRHQPL